MFRILIMNIYEMKYNLAINVAKLILPEVKDAIFCGGTALNTFYLNYRYSEDLDIGYLSANPKSSIESLLEKKGYSFKRTEMKLRDIITSEGTEIKMDVFEYESITGIISKDLQGVAVSTLSSEEFTLSKTISFMTREDKNGLIRDAYDLYKLGDILDVFSVVKKYKEKICSKVDVVQANFQMLYENPNYAAIAIEPLLKSPVNHNSVEKFMKRIGQMMR